jgi:hypothetical protein
MKKDTPNNTHSTLTSGEPHTHNNTHTHTCWKNFMSLHKARTVSLSAACSFADVGSSRSGALEDAMFLGQDARLRPSCVCQSVSTHKKEQFLYPTVDLRVMQTSNARTKFTTRFAIVHFLRLARNRGLFSSFSEQFWGFLPKESGESHVPGFCAVSQSYKLLPLALWGIVWYAKEKCELL